MSIRIYYIKKQLEKCKPPVLSRTIATPLWPLKIPTAMAMDIKFLGYFINRLFFIDDRDRNNRKERERGGREERERGKRGKRERDERKEREGRGEREEKELVLWNRI
jgi:hypothetical protein